MTQPETVDEILAPPPAFTWRDTRDLSPLTFYQIDDLRNYLYSALDDAQMRGDHADRIALQAGRIAHMLRNCDRAFYATMGTTRPGDLAKHMLRA